ncbi:hypothetical protein [Ilumatobacter sp.]|uniref:PIN-like domain-containing protein n=1 Tax=Ilumatobacter sp. TaxID=1967498 RepID=UPI003753A1B7
MPSGRVKRQLEPAPFEFFLDRGLGRYNVAKMLRSHGHVVHVMADVYPDGADQTMDDPDWMLDVDNRGWVALTKDASIVRAHRNDLESSSLRMFSLDSSKLTGEQMAARFELHLNRIIQRCSKPGPFFDVLHARSIERRYP